MKNIFKTILLIVAISNWPTSVFATSHHDNKNENNSFQFVIANYHTTRQSGQIVNVYIKYAYKKNLPPSEYFDYKLMRLKILKYMEPSEEFPAEIYWEIIASSMGRELMKDFPLDGVRIQLMVLDNQNPDSYEPGDHGPIFTMGHVDP